MARYLTVILFTAFFASTLTYMVTDPRHYASVAQEAIIHRVVEEYCHSPMSSADRYIGRTGAAATIAMQADLGALAYAEVLKCKIGM
jgi:hypothetical protein